MLQISILERAIAIQIVLIIVACIQVNGLFIDNTDNTELVQEIVGNDLRLECNLKGIINDDNIDNIKIHWYFKSCYGKFDSISKCRELQDNDWVELPCEQSFCKTDLFLRNLTEKYSGLYKCTIYPYRSDGIYTLDIQLVRTYQLDVKNTSLIEPEILDAHPMNQSAELGSEVIFQCRVHSAVHSTIKWFRRLPEITISNRNKFPPRNETNFQSNIVKYNGYSYELLTTPREKIVGSNIYLSTLIINSVRIRNEGFYACVAISYQGYNIREAYLDVYANEDDDYWLEYDYNNDEKPTDPRKFGLFFLMPLGLAILPLLVWLGIRIYKLCRSRRNIKNVRRSYVQDETLAEHCILKL